MMLPRDSWKFLNGWLSSGKFLPLLLPFLLGPTPVFTRSADLTTRSRLNPPSSHQTSALLQPIPASPLQATSTTTQPQKVSPASPQSQPKPSPAAKSAAPVKRIAKRQQPAAPPLPVQGLPPIPLRVAIADGATNLTIGASTQAVVIDEQGQVLQTLPAMESAIVQANGDTIQLGSAAIPSVVWIRPTQDGLVNVEGRWYRGAVRLVLLSQRLLAVNYVDLESYLYSVVGAEMPSYWSSEALKAQAVAARSYAIVHLVRPASDFYDLGSTTRWQAYEGVASETNTTQSAVNNTRGMFVSYQGGVVESLYAASDSLIREAHGGFGMSQEGAQKLAQQSYNFQEILGYFFPGTHLATLKASL